jgi:hypothetical protein
MSERDDLQAALSQARSVLRYTAEGLTDHQANQASTVSSLTVGGLIKHVSLTEQNWVRFIREGAAAFSGGLDDHASSFRLGEQSLADALQRYADIAADTDELLRTVDLDAGQELPPAPWFTPGERRSARRTFVHIIAETAQHAGHADIIREAIDGQKTMG